MGRKRSRRPSKSIGFKASQDTDADIIAWWDAMPDGERSDVLRLLIRTAISSSVVQKKEPAVEFLTQIGEDTSWIRNALTDLPAYLERLIAQVASSRAASLPEEERRQLTETPQLDQEALERRKAKMRQSTW